MKHINANLDKFLPRIPCLLPVTFCLNITVSQQIVYNNIKLRSIMTVYAWLNCIYLETYIWRINIVCYYSNVFFTYQLGSEMLNSVKASITTSRAIVSCKHIYHINETHDCLSILSKYHMKGKGNLSTDNLGNIRQSNFIIAPPVRRLWPWVQAHLGWS